MKNPNNNAQSAICLVILAMCVVVMLCLSDTPPKSQAGANVPLPPRLGRPSCKFIATGNRLGTYYPAGIVIANCFNESRTDERYVFKALETNGAIENMQLLKKGEVLLGMVESRIINESAGANAAELRVVWPLWYDVVQIAKTNDKFNPGASFPGRLNVFLGQEGSSTRRTSNEIIKALDRQITQDAKEVPLQSVPAFIHTGNIGYALLQSGLPNNIIADALSYHNCSLYSFSDEEIKKILLKVSSSIEFEIPAGYYTDKQPQIKTIAMPNMLVAPANVPNEQIEDLLETMLSSLSTLKLKHKALGNIETAPQRALELMKTVKLPIHNGALSWLKKHGASIRGIEE